MFAIQPCTKGIVCLRHCFAVFLLLNMMIFKSDPNSYCSIRVVAVSHFEYTNFVGFRGDEFKFHFDVWAFSNLISHNNFLSRWLSLKTLSFMFPYYILNLTIFFPNRIHVCMCVRAFWIDGCLFSLDWVKSRRQISYIIFIQRNTLFYNDERESWNARMLNPLKYE